MSQVKVTAMKISTYCEIAGILRSGLLLRTSPEEWRAVFEVHLIGTLAVTQAAGYRFAYDAAHDQYAHPAAAYVVTAQGRVSRVLTSLGLNGPDLRLALVEAGQGNIGGIADQIHLLCYGFDPARGIYTASITRLLNIGGVATATLLAGGIGLMLVARRRRRA